MEYPLIPHEEIKFRVSKLQSILVERNMDACLLSYRAYCYYFSGSSQAMSIVIPKDDEPRIFVRRAEERLREESPWKNVTKITGSKPLFSYLKSFKKIGIPFDRITAKNLIYYTKNLGDRFVDISEVIEELKSIKSPFEISCIEKAGEIAKRVFEEALNYLKEGMSEIEIAGVFDMLGRKYGSEGFLRTGDINYEAYTWHVVSGENAFYRSYIETVVGGRGLSPSFPCGAGRRIVKRNEPIMVDFGVAYMGYMVDHARIYVIGEPSKKLLDFYEKIIELQKRVEDICIPGAICSSIFEKSKDIAIDLGIENEYLGGPSCEVNFLAHGIGLELSDKPIIGKGQDYKLKENMVFAMEPKLLLPGEGPVGVEDVYVVEKKGVRKLTKTENKIFVVK